MCLAPQMPAKKRILVVHCWTAPRSRSTALLYSFEARGADCTVAIDEPLKREWLIAQGELVQRPYKNNMIDGICPDKPEEELLWKRETLSLGERIHQAALRLAKSEGVQAGGEPGLIFIKHMSKTHFLYDFENDVAVDPIEGVELEHKHMFLIRDPVAILRSWDVLSTVHNESCSAADVGIVPLVAIYNALKKRLGDQIHVTILDSDELVADPQALLKEVCRDLGVSFKPCMMSWKAGEHECDSRHAPWWYINARSSTGWKVGSPKKKSTAPEPKPLNPKLMPALSESFPAYQMLAQICLEGKQTHKIN